MTGPDNPHRATALARAARLNAALIAEAVVQAAGIVLGARPLLAELRGTTMLHQAIR